MWVSYEDYKQAAPDPLRECAAKIVDDMNRNHWEDVRRFCSVYAHLDILVLTFIAALVQVSNLFISFSHHDS